MAACAATFAGSCAYAAEEAAPDTVGFLIPERVIPISGNAARGSDLVAILYDRSELHFSDPSAPRFLFFDREGKVVLGIGGYVKGSVQYDFDGSIDKGASFVTSAIPVPADPALRNQLYGTANHSTVFLQLLGQSKRFGTYEMFIQTNFTGDGPSGHELKLKQAYVRLGYVTAGLTNSTFVDGAAGTPTVDDQGPNGEMSAKNILLKYAPRITKNVSAGIGLEIPSASYSNDPLTRTIKQRFPDIPAYIQYKWANGSHVRASALYRDLSYRDLRSSENRFESGWAVQLSTILNVCPAFTIYGQGSYGKGYARYNNDLSGCGYDLIASPSDDGKMIAPASFAYEAGIKVAPSRKCFLTAVWSQTHLYDQRHLGADAYKYANYLSINAFYHVAPDMLIGLEYVNGSRHNIDGEHNGANRIGAMLKYSF